MTTAICYGRVSSTRQSDRANSLLAQSEQFIRFGDSKSFDLGAPIDRDFGEHGKLVTRSNIYFEAVSAFKNRFFDRPVGKLVAARLMPGDVLLVTRLDRAWRLTSDCLNTVEALKRRRVQTYIISFLDGEPLRMDTAQGLICLTTCACFAQVESMFRSERLKVARAARNESGLYNGGPPRLLFRAIRDGSRRLLVPCHEQREHSRLFYQLHFAQGWPIERIVEHTRSEGIQIPSHAIVRRRHNVAPSTTYERQRIVGLVRAEVQIRRIAERMSLPDDDERVLHAWLRETASETLKDRKTLPAAQPDAR